MVSNTTLHSSDRTQLKQQGLENTVNSALDIAMKDNPDMAIQVHRIGKAFGRERILWDVSVNFRKKQIHGVIGRNGSGKTVMLKCICGFLPVEFGMIRVLGKVVGKGCDFALKTGVLIEGPGFLPCESAHSNLKWLAQLNGNIPRGRIDELISLVGLDTSSKKHVGRFSLGMRQRLGIAQALLDDPDVLILDEPMNGLDKHGVEDIRKLLTMLRQQGKTIVLASHFAQDIEELCDTVHEMDQGVLTQIQ